MNETNDSYEVLNALALVSVLAFVVIGFRLMNDRCLVQVPILPQLAGNHGSPTPIAE